MKKFWVTVSTLICLTVVSSGLAQDRGAPRTPGKPGGDKYFGKQNKKKPENTRSVEGTVLKEGKSIVPGAVVQIKDTKTLRVRSYLTLKDGKYRFHGLSTETDYELKATFEGRSSKTRRLTVFDSRKKANIDLRLKPKA